MNKEKSVEIFVSGVCSVIFCAFTFLYLFFFQNDLLAYVQKCLSHGMTVYNALPGAVIITAVLFLLSLLSATVLLRHFSFMPAIYHMPSALVLAIVCDVHIRGDGVSGLYGDKWVGCTVVFVLLLLANFLLRNREIRFINRQKSFLVNLLAIFIIILIAVFTGNTNEADHVRLRSERYIMNDDYEGVIRLVGKHAVNTPEMTMLKAFALAKTGRMGDMFFERNVVKGSENLLPSKDNRLLLMPSMKIFRAIGGVPSEGMSARVFLEKLYGMGKITPVGRNYLYTACLLDRDVEAFAGYFRQDYDTTQYVPKHYAEALEIYRYEHGEMHGNDPGHDILKPGDCFADFLTMKNSTLNDVLRENSVRDVYGGTYWFYYFFTTCNAFTQSVSNEN